MVFIQLWVGAFAQRNNAHKPYARTQHSKALGERTCTRGVAVAVRASSGTRGHRRLNRASSCAGAGREGAGGYMHDKLSGRR